MPFWPFWTIFTIFDNFLDFFLTFLFRIFSGRFDTSGSMIPRLVPEISPHDAFCDVVVEAGVAGVVVGIGDSRSWIPELKVTQYTSKFSLQGLSLDRGRWLLMVTTVPLCHLS